jgi:hypothetical protein
MRLFGTVFKGRSNRMFQRPSLGLVTLEDHSVPASVTLVPIWPNREQRHDIPYVGLRHKRRRCSRYHHS